MSPSPHTACPPHAKHTHTTAFTLIELSIVLVIIGLVVGGVLVGQDLVRSAGERATITQVEKFNTAVNTFFGKYGYLPGDIPAAAATQAGLTPRGPYPGEGDGNGVIQGNSANCVSGCNWGWVDSAGETVMFWVDLTTANGLKLNLIEGSFSTASPTNEQTASPTQLNMFLPAAKIGGGNYFYVYSNNNDFGVGNSLNYFGLSAVTSIGNSTSGCQNCLNSSQGLTVKQAYDIDRKVDDGLPTTGRVLAQYVDGNILGGVGSSANAASPSATTCYDTTSSNYSLTQNGGAGVNCGLSFQMQGGD